MARPRKEIDQTQFEKLCAMQCTQEEICGWFDVCSDTLSAWCKRTYKKGFSETYAQKRGLGKISLRRSQWRLAETNATMAIWLGKQYLGQADTVAEGRGDPAAVAALISALRGGGEENHADTDTVG